MIVRTLLLFILLGLFGCLGGGDDVDTFFGTETEPGNTVVVPPSSDLSITISSPANGEVTGYEKVLSGTCGTAGKIIRITGAVTALSFCDITLTWTVTLDLAGLPIGTVNLSAQMIDEALNESGTPATLSLNKTSVACDLASARADTFGNFSTGGDGGTVPWVICTTTQMNNLNSFLADNAELGNDIDFGGSLFNGIGNDYTGTFDGSSFTISNIVINSTGNERGLFRRVNGTVTIRNLNVVNAQVQVTGYRSGIVVGYAPAGAILTIDNVHVRNSSIVTGHATNGESGGLLGRAGGAGSTTTITNSSVTNVNVDSKNRAGGLVGYLVGGGTLVTMSDNSVIGGSVLGRQYVGGMIGHQAETNYTGSNLTSSASVTGTNGNIGGFAGETRGAHTDVSSTGVVNRTGGNNIGGLIGYMRAGSVNGSSAAATRPVAAVLPQTCFATGVVNGGAAQFVGGLIGRNEADLVQSCYATGEVTGGTPYVAGLIGYTGGDRVDDSFATGIVLGAGDYVAGLVGYMTNTGEDVLNSYSESMVTSKGVSPEYIAGLVGRFRGTVEVDNCYASGDVTATSGDGSANLQYIGGLIGYAQETGAQVVDSYATGNVSVASTPLPGNARYVGGLIGYSNNVVSTSYASGDVTFPGGEYLGGLNGYQNIRAATQVYALGDVTGDGGFIGGLIGCTGNNTTVSESYALGDVDGGTSRYVGGLVGYARSGTDQYVDNFAVNTVRGGQDVGGVVGLFRRQSNNAFRRHYHVGDVVRATGGAGADNTFGPVVGVIQSGNAGIENGTNFYNSDFSVIDEASGLGFVPNTINQTALTTAQMLVLGNFSTYDFALPVWEMPPGAYTLPNGVSYGFPILDWMN